MARRFRAPWVAAFYEQMSNHAWFETAIVRRVIYWAFIPSASPWPVLTSQTLFCSLLSIVLWFHYYVFALSYMSMAFSALALMISYWCKDLIAEGQYMGVYLIKNMRAIRLGFKLFIVSEAMFFFALFWAYFHYSLNPSIWIASMWPPYGMKTISPWGFPLLNTMILLMSGITLTYVQKIIIRNKGHARFFAIKWFQVTIFLALCFLLVQYIEFTNAPFNINDSVYGSIFFLITGTHGLHVIAGTGFLIVCFMRVVARHFYQENTLALDLAAMYWHFVDIVWILVFLIVYWWGGSSK